MRELNHSEALLQGLIKDQLFGNGKVHLYL